jgi:hypothetical protein
LLSADTGEWKEYWAHQSSRHSPQQNK